MIQIVLLTLYLDRACGVDEGVTDFPYIYFANPTNPKYLYVTTCVSECPSIIYFIKIKKTFIRNKLIKKIITKRIKMFS
jgi:hypothetical protein